MNEQQLAAMKQALEALEMGLGQVSGDYDTALEAHQAYKLEKNT